jgi:hypothetical protein
MGAYLQIDEDSNFDLKLSSGNTQDYADTHLLPYVYFTFINLYENLRDLSLHRGEGGFNINTVNIHPR